MREVYKIKQDEFYWHEPVYCKVDSYKFIRCVKYNGGGSIADWELSMYKDHQTYEGCRMLRTKTLISNLIKVMYE